MTFVASIKQTCNFICKHLTVTPAVQFISRFTQNGGCVKLNCKSKMVPMLSSELFTICRVNRLPCRHFIPPTISLSRIQQQNSLLGMINWERWCSFSLLWNCEHWGSKNFWREQKRGKHLDSQVVHTLIMKVIQKISILKIFDINSLLMAITGREQRTIKNNLDITRN